MAQVYIRDPSKKRLDQVAKLNNRGASDQIDQWVDEIESALGMSIDEALRAKGIDPETLGRNGADALEQDQSAQLEKSK